MREIDGYVWRRVYRHSVPQGFLTSRAVCVCVITTQKVQKSSFVTTFSLFLRRKIKRSLTVTIFVHRRNKSGRTCCFDKSIALQRVRKVVLRLELPRIDDERQACLSEVFVSCTLYALMVKGNVHWNRRHFWRKFIWTLRALKNEETVDAFSLLQRELAMTEKLVKQTLSKEPAIELRVCASLTN